MTQEQRWLHREMEVLVQLDRLTPHYAHRLKMLRNILAIVEDAQRGKSRRSPKWPKREPLYQPTSGARGVTHALRLGGKRTECGITVPDSGWTFNAQMMGAPQMLNRTALPDGCARCNAAIALTMSLEDR